MKTVRDLPLWPLWVNPEHRVKSALVMMRGHGVPSIGVIKGDTFLGVVHIQDLAGVEDAEPVELVMRRGIETVPPDMPLRRLAELMSELKLDSVPVLHDEEFLGIITAGQLLQEVWRNYDPLTQLPWSDSLREWGIARLQEGKEVTVIFFDLDDFGQFNKRYGHVIGDKVLQLFANTIQKGIDNTTDHLCRFGGDEFVIATVRSRDNAKMLAGWLQQKIADLDVQGVAEPIAASVGIFGGRRTKERENLHFAATLDNLINKASREAIAEKKKKRRPESEWEEPQEETVEDDFEVPAPQPKPEILSVRTSHADSEIRAVVVLRVQSRLYTGVFESAKSEADAAARAAAKALQESALASTESNVDDVQVSTAADGMKVVTVVVAMGGDSVGWSEAIETTEGEAAAKAVLGTLLGE